VHGFLKKSVLFHLLGVGGNRKDFCKFSPAFNLLRLEIELHRGLCLMHWMTRWLATFLFVLAILAAALSQTAYTPTGCSFVLKKAKSRSSLHVRLCKQLLSQRSAFKKL
jgi:hypothetical protein